MHGVCQFPKPSGTLSCSRNFLSTPKNTNKQSTQVKALVSAPTKPKKSKTVKPAIHGKNCAADVAAYYAGLHDPFSRAARGVRYLDPVSYPTTTAVSEGVFNVTTDGSGRASLAVLSDPFLSLVSVAGTVVTSSGGSWPDNPHCWYTATTGQMAGVFSTFRTVASGIQIRNLQQPVTTQGRLYAAKSSGTGFIPGPTFLQEPSNLTNLLNLILNVGDVDSRILTLPESTETTMQDLIQSCVSINSRPCSAGCTNFKNPLSQNSWSPSHVVGEAIYQVPSGPLVSAETSNMHVNGRDIILLNFVGCPPNMTIAEIKYVYHYEGTPSMSGTAGIVTPDSMGTTAYMPRTAAAIEAGAAYKAQSASSWVDDALDTGKKIASGVAKAIKFATEVGEVIAPLLA